MVRLMLNLCIISDDKKQGVLCESLDQVRELVEAIKSQRPDIDIGDWTTELKESKHANRVYLLNYCGHKRLQHGRVSDIKTLGLSYLQFHELLMYDLPEIDANQTDILSLLGL